MASVFDQWIVVFPGKMGISWKPASGPCTKEEAEAGASKWCNAAAVPLEFFENYKKNERRLVIAEQLLVEHGVTSTQLDKKVAEKLDSN